MKYLFFDCEYATSKGGICKICEFGYVIVDEKFNIPSRGNFIINPNINKSEWDWRVVRTILTRKICEYERKPTFKSYYDRIKKVLKSVDYVFGHTIKQDVKALNDDCKRYNLPSIDFEFYDVCQLYKSYSGAKKSVGVTKILEELKIEGDNNAHDAETDSYNVMIELKKMLDNLEISIFDMIEICPSAKDETKNYIIKSDEENEFKSIKKYIEELNGDGTNEIKKHGLNRKKFLQFLDNVKPQKDGIKLKGKNISISLSYQKSHYKQMLNLIQLVVNEGGKLILKASISDIFVKYDSYDEDGTLFIDERYESVVFANENGGNIEIIGFDDLLNILGISNVELDKMPIPSFDFLFDDNALIIDPKEKELLKKIKKIKEYNSNNENENEAKETLADVFPDLFEKLKKDLE